MVVSTVSYPKVSVHHTLRAMLIAVCLYPKFLHYLPSVHSAFILKSWVKAFCKVNERKYTHLPLSSLLSEASLSMDAIRNLMYGGRLTLTSSPNVKDLLINLHVNVLTLMEYMIQQGVYSRPPKRRSRSRKKKFCINTMNITAHLNTIKRIINYLRFKKILCKPIQIRLVG